MVNDIEQEAPPKPAGEGAADPLDIVAGKVRALFKKAEEADAKANDFRISAGCLLLELRRRVSAGEAGKGMTWTQYVRRHVKRSMRDVQKVMRLARAPDPQAAANEERAEARERMATVRARQAEAANVRRLEPEPPADWHTVRDLAAKLDANGWARFWDWVVDENERRGLPRAA